MRRGSVQAGNGEILLTREEAHLWGIQRHEGIARLYRAWSASKRVGIILAPHYKRRTMRKRKR
jgi:hypothetical protein